MLRIDVPLLILPVMPHRDTDPRLLQFAHELRNRSTDSEQRLWQRLRNRRLGGFKFRRQYPIEGYVVDFICIEAKLVVELDGGQHADEAAIEYDRRRSEAIEAHGFRVIRFWDCDVLRDLDAVEQMIYRELTGESPFQL